VTPQSLRSKVVGGLFWLSATKASGQGITWLVTLIVVRLLSPQDYGLMGLAIMSTRFLQLFSELGLGAAVVQRRNLSTRQLSDVWWVISLVNVVFFVVLIAGAPAIARYFSEPALVAVVRAMGAVFVIGGFGCASGFLLQRHMDFRKKAQAEIYGSIAGALATLALAAKGWGVWSLVLGYLASQAIMNLLYFVYAPIRIDWRFSVRNVRDMLDFGTKVAFARVFWWISTSADGVIIGRVLGTVQLGYFGLAAQFAALPLDRIVSLITQVALPSFSAIQHDEERVRRYYVKLVGTIALVTFPMFAGIALLAQAGVHLVLTDKWLPIVAPMQVLCLVACLRGIETMNAPVLLAKDRPGIPLFNSFLQAAALPIAFWVGTRWGIYGVALGWVVLWPALFALVTGQTLRVIDLRVSTYLAAIRHPLAATGIMAFVVLMVRRIVEANGVSLMDLGSLAAAGAATYVAYHAMFNRAAMLDVVTGLRFRGVLQRSQSDPAVPAAAHEA
jgi:O-antigen/teichoic acid export membrane protein